MALPQSEALHLFRHVLCIEVADFLHVAQLAQEAGLFQARGVEVALLEAAHGRCQIYLTDKKSVKYALRYRPSNIA